MHQSPSYANRALAETAAGGRVTTTSYDDDPLLRVSSVVPPGHDDNSAVDARYGNWAAGSGLGLSHVTVDDEKGVATTSVYDSFGRLVSKHHPNTEGHHLHVRRPRVRNARG